MPKNKTKTVEILSKRVEELKTARKRPLIGQHRSIEDIWREVDLELTPHELNLSTGRVRFEADQDTGLRSRLVKIGEDDGWQSNKSEPTFYVKVQTALSLLIEQNPEAVFIPTASKYEKNTALAYSNWKSSWEVSGAKQQLKNFVFNQSRYGLGVGRTYPKLVKMEKQILRESYAGEKERDKYDTKTLTKFNDLCRQSLNPWQVWISEMARPGDRFSIDDWYYEEDYSWDKFQQEFPVAEYPEAVNVKKGAFEASEPDKTTRGETGHSDMVTVGFYENQVTDKRCVWVPSQKILLEAGPMPNDDGVLSLWIGPWTLRDDRSIYGIGIYEIIRNDSVLYDRMQNMTIDQLTLSIYKMFFYKGVNVLGENGRVVVSPGRGEQVLDPKDVTWMEVPGPGIEAWRGLQFIQDRQDINSGVPQQLSGKFAGKTLGQDLEAKAAALERMKTPLDFILDALQEEAYISLSWMKQILSTPEVLSWTDEDDLVVALAEAGLGEAEIKEYLGAAARGGESNELLYQEPTGEVDEFTGEPVMRKRANVYREASMALEKNEGGELIESSKSRFYRYGVHLPLKMLDWRGIVRVKPQSVLSPSKELVKRMKLDLFNLVYPAVQGMLQAPQFIPILLSPIKQVLKAFEEDTKDWFDEKMLSDLYKKTLEPVPPETPKTNLSLSVNFDELGITEENPTGRMSPVQKQLLEKFLDIKVEEPLFVPSGGGGILGPSPLTPASAPTPPPASSPRPLERGIEGIRPLAPIGESPETFGGALQGARDSFSR